MYIQKTVICGRYIITKKCFSLRYNKKALRSPNMKKTSEKQKEINKRNREEEFLATCLANFDIEDWYITLTYTREARPDSIKSAHKEFGTFIQKVKRYCKRHNIECLCCGKTEMPPSGAVHHHFMMNKAVPLEIILKYWTKGRVKDIQRIYSMDDMKLVNYIAKGEGAKHSVVEYKFFKTRNLKKPIIKRKVIKANSWTRVPKAKKGYQILEDSIFNYTDIVGFDAQRYIMVRRN